MLPKILFVSLVLCPRFFASETTVYFCERAATDYGQYNYNKVLIDEFTDYDFYCAVPRSRDIVFNFLSSNMSVIPYKLFSKFGNIRKVSLVDCGIEQVLRNSLEQAEKLTELDLSHNKITELRNYVFEGAGKLQKLNLTANNISVIEEKSFHSVRALRVLLLGGNSLKSLSAEVMVELTALEAIVLANNQLHKLEKRFFAKNIALKIVHLQNNYLTAFEEETFCNPNECDRFIFDEILLNNNTIKQLNLANIKVERLSVKNNQLNQLQVSPTVEELYCSHNKLSEIVIDETSKSQLHKLDITNNSVSSLKSIAQFRYLHTLYLGVNPLNPLNLSSFASLKTLKNLGLGQTNIANLRHGMFGHQEQLEWLDLAFNELADLDLDILTTCTKLNTLFLDGNRLKSIDYEQMRIHFTELTLLGIAGNDWNCTYLVKFVRYCSTQSIELYKPLSTGPPRDQPSVKGIYCLDDKHTTHNWTATIQEPHTAYNESDRTDDAALTEMFQNRSDHPKAINRSTFLEAAMLDLKRQQFQLQKDLNALRDTQLYAQQQTQYQLATGNSINGALLHNNNIMAAVLFLIGLNLTFIVGFFGYWIYCNRIRTLFSKHRRHVREGCNMTAIMDDQI